MSWLIVCLYIHSYRILFLISKAESQVNPSEPESGSQSVSKLNECNVVAK